MTPKVSVCMPTYNCCRYLPEAIESVLRQNYSDFEFIIIDDGSTDNSAELIRSYAGEDKRITLIVNERNLGQAKNLNLCLQRARGEYIKFMFSDDFFASDDALKTLVAVLEQDRQVAVVTSARYLVDEKSTILGVLSEYEGDLTGDGTDVIRECLLEQKNKIGEPTAVLFRKNQAGRGFIETYNQNVDWEMWLHLLGQGKFAYIHKPLCSFRTHSGQQTKLNVQQGSHFADLFRVGRDYGRRSDLELSFLQRMYISYCPAFEIWKFFRKYRKITLPTALEKIHAQYGLVRFVVLYPVYRIYKTHLSVKRRVNKILKRGLSA